MLRWNRMLMIVSLHLLMPAIVGGIVAFWVVRRNAEAQKTIAAHEFVLLDDGGRVAAKLGWEDRQPGFRLFDRSGHLRSALFLEPNGVPDLYLYDQNQETRAALNLFDSGVPNLAFISADQKQMVWTDYTKDGFYNVSFVNIGNDALHVIGSRRLRSNASGLHEDDTREAVGAH